MSSGYLEMDESSSVTLSNQHNTNLVFSGNVVPMVVRASQPSLELPAGMVKWSHLEVIIQCGASATTATTTTFKAYVTWDELGLNIAAGPTQSALTMINVDRGAAPADQSAMASAVLDISPSRPPEGLKSKAYVWFATTGFLATGSNQPKVVRCRLYWHSLTKG